MASMIGGITSTAMGTVGTAFKIGAALKWEKEMKGIMGKDPAYTSSPYAKNTLGLAQTLLQSRMPGAASRERNIYGSGANAMANVNRNATDSSQALALGAGIQGQEGQQFDNLQQQEGQDYYTKVQNLNQANSGMTDEYHNEYDDQVRRWQDQVNYIMTKLKARQAGGNDIAGLGAGLGGSGSTGMGK